MGMVSHRFLRTFGSAEGIGWLRKKHQRWVVLDMKTG